MNRRKVAITMPLPDMALSPNARVHWRIKAAATRRYRGRAWAEALAAMGGDRPMWLRAVVTLRFWFADARRHDADNCIAACKPLIDGLVSAGLIADDSIRNVKLEWIVGGIDRENPRVEIEVTEQ